MLNTKTDLIGVLRQFNPWWRREHQSGLPTWQRAAFAEVKQWVQNPPALRAVLLSGARQIGKTTLLLQTIESLLAEGVPPGQILYATFDQGAEAGHDRALWRAAGAGAGADLSLPLPA